MNYSFQLWKFEYFSILFLKIIETQKKCTSSIISIAFSWNIIIWYMKYDILLNRYVIISKWILVDVKLLHVFIIKNLIPAETKFHMVTLYLMENPEIFFLRIWSILVLNIYSNAAFLNIKYLWWILELQQYSYDWFIHYLGRHTGVDIDFIP